MATVKKAKTVNVKLTRGIRMFGKPIRPHTDKDKKKPTVITVTESFANMLVSAAKGEITKDKANTKVAAPKDDLEAELDAALGE